MRSVLYLAATVVFAVGCDVVPDSSGEDLLDPEVSVSEQASEVAAADAEVLATKELPAADREKLVETYLAEFTPEDVGEPCSVVGSVCSPAVDAIVRECSGFSSVCDSTATQDVLRINFLCLPSSSGNVCTAVSEQDVRTVACTVPTNGRACSTGCGGSFCIPFSTECAERANRVRDCLSNGVCSNDSCVNQTATREVVGSCERDTDTFDCTPRFACEHPAVGLCHQSVCHCMIGPP